jgi:hypothetical protein
VTPVIWSPQAIRDVESIRAFIAQDHPRTLSWWHGASLPQSSVFSHFQNLAGWFPNDKIRRSAKSS